jgi:hypothetical protein
MNIDLILTEWCYRLPKGYPTTAKDYEVLYDVLIETSKISLTEARSIITRAQNIVEAPSNESNLTFRELGLPEDVVRQILIQYNSLSESEKEEFNKNYRAHTIESYVESGYRAFEKFYYVNIGGARGGMGNGEIAILLGVADSKPGGTAQHDIVMPYGQWEVKELGKGNKFDPAAEGLSSKFKLTDKIQDFYKNIVLPVDQIGDPYEQLHHLVDPSSHEQLKRLIMIFETRFSEAIDLDKLQSLEWKKSAMFNWYNGFRELHDIFYNTKLDTSVKDTRLTVNTDGNEESYWIDDTDADFIRQNAGTKKPASITVGDLVSNQNTDIIIWFKRIARNEFIREPDNFITELNKIKSSFFNNISGLIWYYTKDPVPHIATAEEFAIDTLSQGRYRFVLKNISANNGYSYIEQQS